MELTNNTILDTINKAIREEKGNRVTIDSFFRDAELDSFGITVLFLTIDDEYDYFKKGEYGYDPFSEIKYDKITIKEIIDTCKLENTTT